MAHMRDMISLIKQTLGVDMCDPTVREKALKRLRIFTNVVNECKENGNFETAEALQRIYRNAIFADDHDIRLICMAMLVGSPESIDVPSVQRGLATGIKKPVLRKSTRK